MPFFAGDIFVSDVHKKPVLDQVGEEIGKLKDIIVSAGEPFPAVTALVAAAGRKTYILPWDIVNLFNRRVMTVSARAENLGPASVSPNDILIIRDLLDKQIVDINGAKLVRVNDLRLGDVNGRMCLVAADLGLRGSFGGSGWKQRARNCSPCSGTGCRASLSAGTIFRPWSPS